MFKRYWIAAFALGLVLGPGYAQNEANQPGETASEQEEPSNTSASGIPVRIIEDPESALAAEKREAEAHEYQYRDLVAQQRMADATEAMNEATHSMKWAAWVSAFFVLIGTGLLWRTLHLTRLANEAAQQAVKVTRDIGHEQNRAYIYTRSVTASVFSEEGEIGVGFIINFENYGKTPAIIESIRSSCCAVDAGGPYPDRLEFSPPTDEIPAWPIGPGGKTSTGPQEFFQEGINRSANGEVDLFLSARVDYTDMWGASHTIERCWWIEVIDPTINHDAPKGFKRDKHFRLKGVGPNNRAT